MRIHKKLLMAVSGLGLAVCMTAAVAANDKPVIIGSTNFAEQLVLANIYAGVLKANDIKVEMRLNLGSRELVFPALEAGELDILPEYTGALLAFLSKGESHATSQEQVVEELRKNLPDGLVALKPSPAQDKDALVVTQETAKKYDLKTISDLKPVAGKLIIGGPPELKTRYIGIPGLKEVYGVEFAQFRSLDAGGPLTQAALANGVIDVARMFTTQGQISAKDWVILKDDKDLIAAQNLIPVVRKDALTAEIRKLLNQVSAKLTVADLQRMNERVVIKHYDPDVVAADWIEQNF